MGFPRQEYWSRLPFPSPGELPNPGIKLVSPALQMDSLPLSHLGGKKKWSEVAQLCLTLCDPMDCSLSGSSVHGIFQARVLDCTAISFSRGSSRPRVKPEPPTLPALAGGFFTTRTSWETLWDWDPQQRCQSYEGKGSVLAQTLIRKGFQECTVDRNKGSLYCSRKRKPYSYTFEGTLKSSLHPNAA